MEGMERAVTEQIVTKFDNGNVVINSKYDKEQELNKSFSMIYMLGNSLSAILLFIGIMNFINTMSVNVTVRRHELAVLESIGMTFAICILTPLVAYWSFSGDSVVDRLRKV